MLRSNLSSKYFNESVEFNRMELSPNMMILGLVMSSFSFLTIFGNSLVIVSVIKEKPLRSVTNYFIVSLAAADLVMGSLVMPFAISQEIFHGYWFYGELWCDLWHAIDVWSSTCSILNLCAIAVERYYAINNPILHAARISRKRSGFTIGVVWILSAIISFPAILWWRAATTLNQKLTTQCFFTTDSTYLVLSSMLSFYGPLTVMVIVYWKIYQIANATLKSMKTGVKVIKDKSELGKETEVILNVHVGNHYIQKSSSRNPSLTCDPNGKSKFDSKFLDPSVYRRTGRFSSCDIYADKASPMQNVAGSSSTRTSICSPIKLINSKFPSMIPRKRSRKFVSDQRAAKTLGIVMGIFVLCWLPFFICNILTAIDQNIFPNTSATKIMVSLVTWLGYVNSSINPIIYAHSMRDFRIAFLKILGCLELRKLVHLNNSTNANNEGLSQCKHSSIVASDIYKSRSLLDLNCMSNSSIELNVLAQTNSEI